MTREEYIGKKIDTLKETMVSSQRLSLILFALAVISVVVSLLVRQEKDDNHMLIEFLKYGISSITALSGTAMQGVKYTRKNKLDELEYCKGLVDHYETLEEFDKKIVNSALDGVISK